MNEWIKAGAAVKDKRGVQGRRGSVTQGVDGSLATRIAGFVVVSAIAKGPPN